MNRRLARKTLFIVAVMFASAFAVLRYPLRLGLDLQGGMSLILRIKSEGVSREQEREVVEQTRKILERRINAYGLSEAPVQPYGSRGNELLVQLPGISDPSRLKNLLQSPGVLEWYAVEGGPYNDPTDAVAQHGGAVPHNRKLIVTKPALGQERSWFLVDSQPIVRGTDLRDAQVAAGTMGQPVIAFTLSRDAAVRFQQYTRNNIGRRCAIVLDQEILSAPVIEDAIRDSGQIRGPRNLEEAADLAANLRSGALPAAIEVLQERTVGASLGADSIRHGLQAGAAGLAAVIVAMMLYYRRAGANAILALRCHRLL
jgi:preprotein translocase subunit SecD